MKKIYQLCCSSFLVILFIFISPAHAQAQGKAPSVLIVYDAPAGLSDEKLGFAYAIMVQNLLGHFDAEVTLAPVQKYIAGGVDSHDVTFYLGSIYDAPVPPVFIKDVSQTKKTVVWMKHNIWQMAWNPSMNFTAKTGLKFIGLKGLNALPTASNPTPGFFDTINYKGKDFLKYYKYDPVTQVVSADPDVGQMRIVDAAKASAPVSILNKVTGEKIPYIARSNNFWYFGDLPFSFTGPRDRYLVFADLLHDILGVNHPENHQAMVRLEDVGALVSTAAMQTLTDYLFSLDIPFSVATIPLFRDPLGIFNSGIPQEVPLSQASNLKAALNYAIARNGEIVMHGYTHQYNSLRNRYTAISGDDYEFWNIIDNTPVAEDSTAWALGRLQAGVDVLTQNGYPPVAWEAPHYQSSPMSIKAVPQVFSTTYQRVVYYTSDTPNLTALKSRDYAVGQFFPYVINKDYYGQMVLPENIGNIEYIIPADSSSSFNYTWQDLVTNAEYALVVRDGFASFFFHPFWLEPAINKPGFADFQKVVSSITALGYEWVSPSDLIP